MCKTDNININIFILYTSDNLEEQKKLFIPDKYTSFSQLAKHLKASLHAPLGAALTAFAA